jgi:hypothetical protein
VDRHVGAQVVGAVALAQEADPVDAAGHEAAQRHDRQRHVQVEDLVDEALVGVVGRVEEDQREAAGDEDDGEDREGDEAPGELGLRHSSSR